MSSNADIARALAEVFLAAGLNVADSVEGARRLFGRKYRWLVPLARRAQQHFADKLRPRRSLVTSWIEADAGFLAACESGDIELVNRIHAANCMGPTAAARDWILPQLITPGQLAEWLNVSVSELDWFADLKHWEALGTARRLNHYHYRLLGKQFGQVRLIEAPKPRLKQIQRQLLHQLVERIPTHEAAHGFCAGRSILSFVAPHVGRQVVLRLDLQDFFPSISFARVAALYRLAGYPERVADSLAGLCTNVAPNAVWNDLDRASTAATRERLQTLYARPHLPQGAATSPALANRCAYRLDCRLHALAQSAGGEYSRYADDLAFSGDEAFARGISRFQCHASAIAIEEGFKVHHRKTRIMRRGARQHLAGLVVNDRVNLRRRDFDELKATLTNCGRHGPVSQNRAGVADFAPHLQGRVAFVAMVHPARGARLRDLLAQIRWS